MPATYSEGPLSLAAAAGPRDLREVVVVMRHGKRRDAPDDAPVEHNPPLLSGADGVGAVAGSVVSELGPCVRDAIGSAVAGDPSQSPRHIGVDLRVICSPFRRTVQTAKLVAPELTRYLRLTFARAERRTRMRFTMHSSGGVDGVDNQLCEVFGPTRIKCISSNPHQHAPPAVVGLNELNLELDVERTRVGKVPERDARRGRPGWGESLEEAFYRFKAATVGKFAPVASHDGHDAEADAANGHLRVIVTVMITHGDAVAAASDSVGQDQVYACEELGFVTLIRDDHGRVQRAAPLCRGVQILPAEEGGSSSAILHELPDSPAAMALAMDEDSVRRAAAAGEGGADVAELARQHRHRAGSQQQQQQQQPLARDDPSEVATDDDGAAPSSEGQSGSTSASVRTSRGSGSDLGTRATNTNTIDESIQFHESPARHDAADEPTAPAPAVSAPDARSDTSNSPEAQTSPAAPAADAHVDEEVRCSVPTFIDDRLAASAPVVATASARPSAVTRQSDGFHSCCSDADADDAHADVDRADASEAASQEQGADAPRASDQARQSGGRPSDTAGPTSERATDEEGCGASGGAEQQAQEPPPAAAAADAGDVDEVAGAAVGGDGEPRVASSSSSSSSSSSARRGSGESRSSTDSAREPIASPVVAEASTAQDTPAVSSADERPRSPAAAPAQAPGEQGSPDSIEARPSAVARRSEPFASEPRQEDDDDDAAAANAGGAGDSSRRSDGPVSEPYASADSPNRDATVEGPATAPTSARRSADVRAARTRSQLRQPSDHGDGTGSQHGPDDVDDEAAAQPRQRRGQLWRESDRTALYSRLHATMTTSRRSQLSRASSLATARSQSVGTDQGHRHRSPAGAPQLRTASRSPATRHNAAPREAPARAAAGGGESPRPGSRPVTPRPGTPRTAAGGASHASQRGQTPPRSRTPNADPPAQGATATARGRSTSPQSHRPAWCGASRASTPRDPVAAAPSPGPRKHSHSPQRGEGVFSDLYEAAKKRRDRLAAAAQKRREEEAEAVLRATKPRAAAGVSMYNAQSANDQNAAMRKLIAALHADPNSQAATPALPKYRRRIPADELDRQINRLAISHKQQHGGADGASAATKPAHQTREEAEFAKCTFQPHISAKSKELIGSARRQRTPSPQRLYRTRSELDRKNAAEADGRLRREASQLFREHVAANPTFKRRLDFEGDPAAAKQEYIARSVQRMQEERRIHESERILSIHKGVVIGPRCADRDELVGNMKTVGLSGMAMTTLPASAADRRRRPGASVSPSGQRSRSVSAQAHQQSAAIARNRSAQRQASSASQQPHDRMSRSKRGSSARQDTPPGSDREGRPSFERTA